jgi:serine/threonine-protein kinase RsbW
MTASDGRVTMEGRGVPAFDGAVDGVPTVAIDLDLPAVSVDIPPVAQYVGLARTVTTWAAALTPALDADRVSDLTVAVSEACTNAIEAHQRADVVAPVRLHLRATGDELTVVIEDHGDGFEPSALLPRPPRSDPRHLDIERGWGIQLIRALVDEADYEATSAGTVLRLVVRASESSSRGPRSRSDR